MVGRGARLLEWYDQAQVTDLFGNQIINRYISRMKFSVFQQ